MTIVTLVSGCGNAYPGDGTRARRDANPSSGYAGILPRLRSRVSSEMRHTSLAR